ncbi:60 kDa lysophospholipase-like isoform X2 [Boleophthalmus pectinirostris]|uniref:60 kDa lysophospholipase-like isoform X2 n=1 Tax=Boleophthalmus pectinirostris TaxID=150288 RepID=UPI00242D25C0|nr:60 kDa lysophospholipase-like isoform X2 [Boleophthalmus pectinirostris]
MAQLISLAQALSQPILDTIASTEMPHLTSRRQPVLKEKVLLVIYTGGTIGMKYKDGGLVPIPHALEKFLRELPILHDEEYAKKHDLNKRYGEHALVLPNNEKDSEASRIVYIIEEYNPLLDSSNMTPEDWAKIGKDIEKNYGLHDGFVILHGTDTMAYTASALSFMCEHLGKPVIITGAQVPIYDVRNDGMENLLVALLIAGTYDIPEVGLYFHDTLYRGNRVTKVDAESFGAFSSPNLAPLVTTGVNITVNWDIVWRDKSKQKFQVSTEMNQNVGLLRIFPGITATTVRAFLQPPIEGVILETYGSGNAPDKNQGLLDALKEATDSGVIIVNCTQCLRGTVSLTYATGAALEKAGVVPGADMTPEAALTKLSYVLAKKDWTLEEKKRMMKLNLRGEMIQAESEAKLCLSDSCVIQAIAKSLSLSCTEELGAVRDALTPSLACAAAKTGDIEALEALKQLGSHLFFGDYDGRTPLHVACCEGNLNAVQYLLSQGATVHAKDRYGATPLSNAVHFRHKEVVELLRKTGAHLSRDELNEAGVELCSLAARGDLEGLEIWILAGADLTKPGPDGQTALQAQSAGQKEVVATFFSCS